MKKIFSSSYIVLMLGAILLLTLSGCSKSIETKRSGYYLDRVFEVNLSYKKDKKIAKKATIAIESMYKKLVELDTNLNTLSTISEISALNSLAAARSIEVGKETYQLIKKAYTGSILTDGYFDITWEPLIVLFNQNNLPTYAAIDKAVQGVGYLNIQLDKNFNKVKFSNAGTKISLSLIKRSYAVDMLTKEIKQQGFTKGIVKTKEITAVIGKNKHIKKIALGGKEYKHNISDRAYILLNTENETFYKNADLWKKYLPMEITIEKISNIAVIAPNAVTAEILANAAFFMGSQKAINLVQALKEGAGNPELYEIYLELEIDGSKIVTSSAKNLSSH